MSIKVLQVNVRLTEGGAAKVALDLHDRLNKSDGFDSFFVYGYSKGGRSNPNEDYFKALSLSTRERVIINFMGYKLFNKDLINPSLSKRKLFIKLIENVDVVHLHAIHSFFVPYEWLINILIEKNKRIIWTLHDIWAFTGRCAITDGCDRWEVGCGNCPSLTNYPAVIIDNSKKVFSEKRAFLDRLIKQGCIFVAPSIHLAETIKTQIPSKNLKVIQNGLDLETETAIKNLKLTTPQLNKKIKVIIIAHDLSYNAKTDQKIILSLLDSKVIDLYTVGKNSPFMGDNVHNFGYIKEKKELLEIYHQMDVMLFTSKIDNFPLVIGESLCSGLPVIATESAAASEVLSLVNANTVKCSNSIKNIIENSSWLKDLYCNLTREELTKLSQHSFSGQRVLNEYRKLYTE